MHVLRTLLGSLLLAVTAAGAQAHFVWVVSDAPAADGTVKVRVYFGEGAADDEAMYLKGVAHTQLWLRNAEGKPTPVKLTAQTDGGLGHLAGQAAAGKDCVVEAVCKYGVFARGDKAMMLHYYAKHLPASADWKQLGRSSKLPLDIVPSQADGKLTLTVYWQGKPAGDAQVFVGAKELKTAADGTVSCPAPGEALAEIRARIIESKAGKHGDQEYQEVRHYVTLTLGKPAAAGGAKADGAMFPELPEAITSFGAAVAGDWLYVYGGHIGEAHAHSSKNHAQSFCRLNVKQPAGWERLPMGPPVQGLGMVAYQGQVYRIGGMQARNLPDEEGDVHSLISVARFDPRAGKWSQMPDLPAARSSHDAVMLGSKLVVVGGWNLQGGSADAHWYDDVLALDLAAKQPKWETLAKTPFHRRALGAAARDGRLYVLGGISQDRELSRKLDILNTKTGKWTSGPELPLGDHKGNGFGVATFAVDGVVYASGMDGIVYRLSDDKQWIKVATLNTPRFFHRLMPVRPGVLAAIGGAQWGEGHLSTVELITLPGSE